jgi:hypothetical protein
MQKFASMRQTMFYAEGLDQSGLDSFKEESSTTMMNVYVGYHTSRKKTGSFAETVKRTGFTKRTSRRH